MPSAENVADCVNRSTSRDTLRTRQTVRCKQGKWGQSCVCTVHSHLPRINKFEIINDVRRVRLCLERYILSRTCKDEYHPFGMRDRV